jgi:hypothetical protein
VEVCCVQLALPAAAAKYPEVHATQPPADSVPALVITPA